MKLAQGYTYFVYLYGNFVKCPYKHTIPFIFVTKWNRSKQQGDSCRVAVKGKGQTVPH